MNQSLTSIVSRSAKSAIKRLDDLVFKNALSAFMIDSRRDPADLSIDVSGACNLDCIMCSLRQFNKTKNKAMPREIFDRLLPAIARAKSVHLQCNCEPLLNREIGATIAAAKKTNPAVHIGFVSNGLLLSADKAGELIESGLDEIGMSIDGATAETFGRIRRGAHLEKVLGNIRALVRLKEQRRTRKPQITIVTVMSRDNSCELAEILRLAKEIGAEKVVFNGLEPYDEQMYHQTLYSGDIRASRRLAKDLLALAATLDLQIRLPLFSPRNGSCYLRSCVINADGEVFPCSVLSYQRPYVYFGRQLMHPAVSFGNVQERGLSEIWNDPRYRKFRVQIARREFPDYCQFCLIREGLVCP